jgi:hypothetical protein
VQGVYKALGLASASVFRQQEHVYKRTASDQAWDNTTAKPLDPRDPMLETRKRSIRTILAASRSGRGVIFVLDLTFAGKPTTPGSFL